MCFSIPLQVKEITDNHAILENGSHVIIEDTTLKVGDFVRIAGNVIVDTLTTDEGNSIRQLIAELNTDYE